MKGDTEKFTVEKIEEFVKLGLGFLRDGESSFEKNICFIGVKPKGIVQWGTEPVDLVVVLTIRVVFLLKEE